MSRRRVLVAGYGMAAARLAAEIRRRDPDGRRVELTIAGAEPVPACNRVLLTAVLAGRIRPADAMLHDDGWAAGHRVEVRRGASVTAVHPADRRAFLTDGSVISYDDLVLATGSRPLLPPVAGLRAPDGSWAPGASTLRTLADCRRILATVLPGASRAAVLGGGPLGLETARALAARGVQVTVLEAAGHLMERQLDPGAAKILAQRLRGMGVDIRTGAHPVTWCPAPGAPGSSGLYLADGTAVPCDAVIVAAGTWPETALAAATGLRIGSGIVTDDQLITSDPAIRAIGDCAEHDGVAAGLVQPAWEQATVLAGLLTGAEPGTRYRGTPAVTRLRAEGIEVASIGDPHADRDPLPGRDPLAGRDAKTGPEQVETVRLEDPVLGRYGKLTVRGGRVAGAIMLGLPDAAAQVIHLVDRGGPAPSDLLSLLLGRARSPAGVFSPAHAAASLPGDAVVCRCNTVTKAALVAAWRRGARSVPDLAAATRAATGCGSCQDDVGGFVSWLADEHDGGAGGAGCGDAAAGPSEVPAEEVVG